MRYNWYAPEPSSFRVPSERFLELQEADNICRAAYREIMTLAFKAKTCVKGIPALGSVEDLQQMFKTPPSPGMRVEQSVETTIVPLAPDVLRYIMMDVDKWKSTFSHIVHQASGQKPGVLPELIRGPDCPFQGNSILSMKMFNAEFQLPTPFVPKRKFCFVRFEREIAPLAWAIIDVSSDYFQHDLLDSTEKMNCWRRPSGIIIRARENCSEIVWIENVEVPECKVDDNIYSGIINSNLAFCAKRWIGEFLWKLKRNECRFVNHHLSAAFQGSVVRTTLLELASRLKSIYMKCVSEAYDETTWELLSDQGVKILKDTNSLDNNYMAVTRFRVKAKPLSVFNFLIKKNVESQWPNVQSEEEVPEEVINLATKDDSCSITLHEKLVLPLKVSEHHTYEYLLQEASSQEFCSFVISSPVAKPELNKALRFGVASAYLRPSGFFIMPDGSQGLQSDASLVTIALQQVLDDLETDEVIETMSKLISVTVDEISEAVTKEEKHEPADRKK